MRLSGRKTGRTIELGDKVRVEINNVSVVRRRIDFTAIELATRATKKPPRKGAPVPSTESRVGLAGRKKAGREVERAVRQQTERGAAPRREGAGGKLRLGVSHRGLAASGDGGKRRGKPAAGKKRR